MADLTTQNAKFGDSDNTLLLKAATALQELAGTGDAGGAVQYTPQTRTAAEQLQARTNIGGPIIKAGSGTTRSSTSFVTDSEFSVAVGAGETWKLDYKLFFLEGNGAGAKAQLDYTGMTVSEAMGYGSSFGSSTTPTVELVTDGTTPAPLFSASDDSYHTLDYTVTLTATVGGTVNFQWGCSAAVDVTLLSRSTVTATRVS